MGLLLLPEVGFDPKQVLLNIGASIIASTILGVPYYNYSITGPKILFLIIKAPVLGLCHCHEHCCNLRSFHQCSLPLLHMFSRCTVGSTVVVVWGEAGVVLIPGGMLDCLVVPREDTTLHTSNHAGAQRGGYRPFGPAASATIEGASPRALSISADKILLSGGEPRGTDFAGVTLLPCCLSQLPHAWNTIQLIRSWPGRRNAWCICACPRTDSVLCGVRRRGPT